VLLKFEELENKDIIVEQVGSGISTTQRQKDTLKGLGLRGINTKAEIRCTKSIYGMLIKVSHLIKVNLK
jgi:large subunit ribosomal protein L30